MNPPLPGPNPCLVDRMPEGRHPRYVPPEEDFWKVVDVSEGQDKVMLVAFLYLAARRREILRLTWSDIDFGRRRVQLWTRKRADGSYKPDWLPMAEELRSQLLWWWENRPIKDAEALTSHAGMALISRALKHFSVREDLQKLCADLDPGNHHTIAHPFTFGRRLPEMRWRHNLGLERIVTGLSERVRTAGLRLLAIDSTVVSVFGEQIEGAELGYNPHKPGRDSYHPLLAVDVGARAVVDGDLRPGSCGTGHGLEGLIRKLMAESRHPAAETVFRLDKGLTSGAVLDTIEELNAGYVGKVKLTAGVAGQISKIKKWRPIGDGHFAANMTCRLDGWSRPRRMAVIERNRPAKEPPAQLPLFELMEGRYEVVVTNLHLSAENIWRLTNRGTVVEQVIEELKNDFAPRPRFAPTVSGPTMRCF